MMTSTQLKQQVRHCISASRASLLLLTSCGGGTEDEKTTTTAATTPSTNNGDNTGTQTDTTQTSRFQAKCCLVWSVMSLEKLPPALVERSH